MLTPSLEVLNINENIHEIENIFTDMVVNQKRNKQKTIGASELGVECERCLAFKLARIPRIKNFNYPAWQGTASHLWLEKNFRKYDKQRFLTEKRVKIAKLADNTIVYGNIDLYDTQNYMSVDWKFLGDSSLKKYSNRISQQYEIQAQLYGFGLNANDMRCDYVSVCMLPRTSSKFADRKWWWTVYDEDRALWALGRANNMLGKIRDDFGKVNARNLWEFHAYCDSEFAKASSCFTCKDYQLDEQ